MISRRAGSARGERSVAVAEDVIVRKFLGANSVEHDRVWTRRFSDIDCCSSNRWSERPSPRDCPEVLAAIRGCDTHSEH